MTGFTDLLLQQGARVVALQKELTAIPALGPENGGQGEDAKARAIEKILLASGIATTHYDSPDSRVASGIRPNLVACIDGRRKRRLWLFGHMDVVPPGDAACWTGDPWVTRQDGDFLVGRGVEDNQQAICSMLVLAECLAARNITPEYGLGLVFMADEECGSTHGLKWLLQTAPELFCPDDLYIVPDGGSPTGKDIEIAEKAQLWLKFTVTGAQCHASMPDSGNNAFVAASALVVALAGLKHVFNASDSLFKPPCSTFVPTMHEKNVSAVNILPGSDIFYMDCRLLPRLATESVLAEVRALCEKVAAEYRVGVNFEIIHSQAATEVSATTPVVEMLQQALAAVYGVEGKPVGIGGATVAAMLREKGLPAVVWSCLQNTCHQPDERSSISATCRDAAVFAHILMASGGSNG